MLLYGDAVKAEFQPRRFPGPWKDPTPQGPKVSKGRSESPLESLFECKEPCMDAFPCKALFDNGSTFSTEKVAKRSGGRQS